MGYLGRRIGLSQDSGDSNPGGANGAVGGGILDIFAQEYFQRQGKVSKSPGSSGPQGMDASGGVISDYTDPGSGNVYRAHVFNASGSFTVSSLSSALPNNVDYLIIGCGGGGGGTIGGGGGAGALKYAVSQPVSASPYPIVVGAGGAGTAGQGNDGGQGGGRSGNYYGGGGGGGAGQVGQDHVGQTRGGHGGSGSLSNITGTDTFYAGGGGGHTDRSGDTNIRALGGPGGGGDGGIYYNPHRSAEEGDANTGGGGGSATGAGASYDSYSAAGGSGIVIVSYDSGSLNGAGGIVGPGSGGKKSHSFLSTDTFKIGATTDFQIVTDNLKLHLDAGDFSSRGDSTWTDLTSTGYNATMCFYLRSYIFRPGSGREILGR